MERREFLAGVAAAAMASHWSFGADAKRNPGLSYRFGVNYTPSQNWWFCWNDWHRGPILRDLDAIAALGADHLRILLIWPFFQPNATWVSPAHLERLDDLLTMMGERKLDALITVFTGQLSGLYFLPPFLNAYEHPSSAFYTDPHVWEAQELFVRRLADVMKGHANVMGFDFGNEVNTCWQAKTADGDAWMEKMYRLMYQVLPDGIHVNGVDHQPWFEETTFSQRALAAQRNPTIHSYPYWTGSLKYGGPFDPPSVKLIAGMATLVRSYAGVVTKPVWCEEFNTCIEALDQTAQAKWLDVAVHNAIENGVTWFTYWDSHDVNRSFQFNSLEYSLGLLTNDGRVKEQGHMFKLIVDQYRGQTPTMPKLAVPPPPAGKNSESTWKWLLDCMGWKA